MDVERARAADDAASTIAAAIGEPARARMLFCLMDGHARTATELAMTAEVSPSTASAHLSRLKGEDLVRVHAQGKHRYYSLKSEEIARLLEHLTVIAGGSRTAFAPSTPSHLRMARTCYDHIAGSLGVALHDRLATLGWLTTHKGLERSDYDVTSAGERALTTLGVNLEGARTSRRRFAFACLDWSERRAHLGGALGAELLRLALVRKWVARDRGSRGLDITASGRRALGTHFGLRV
jgi:DNA-binding transcriptional ArsR family regulator